VKVFDMTSNLCVWSKAGVVRPRPCHNAFDCTTCSFDRKVQKDIAAGKLLDPKGAPAKGWRDAEHWLELPFTARKCRHMLSGRVPVKYCANGFNCAKCSFDQMIDDSGLVPEIGEVPAPELVAGFALPSNRYFHRGHTWARIEYGGRVRVGLDDFALRLLGPADAFVLPELGAAVKAGQAELVLKRGEKVASFVSPVDGVVVAVNHKVLERASLANESPYEEGWLVVIEPTRLQPNLRNLLFEEEAGSWTEAEVGRLAALVSQDVEHQLAATGGRAIEDIYGNVKGLDWDQLVREFFLT
jgi:glycine cleavage system H lipoate-binding protein